MGRKSSEPYPFYVTVREGHVTNLRQDSLSIRDLALHNIVLRNGAVSTSLVYILAPKIPSSSVGCFAPMVRSPCLSLGADRYPYSYSIHRMEMARSYSVLYVEYGVTTR